MLTPRPWQTEGAAFLASRKSALLADDPRVGKTGAALLACNKIGAEKVTIVTTRSGIPVWQRAVDQWGLKASQRRFVSWGGDLKALARFGHDVLILDESHKAGNPASARTRDIYGFLGEDGLFTRAAAAVSTAERVWALSGTPAPHDNSSWWPMLRSLAPELLEPDVRGWKNFLNRYCVTATKYTHGRYVDVVVGGKNGEELKRRASPFFLRRTQADVGISEPTYDILPLAIDESVRDGFEHDVKRDAVLSAVANGAMADLEMMLANVLRYTGEIKASLLYQPVADDLDGNDEKIVLAYWHRHVGDMLEKMFAPYGALRLDGATPLKERERLQALWATGPQRVFLAQMEAAGEAIDLSAAASMIIVEPVFRPATMRQVSLRITNVNARRTPLVRVAVLAGSIDEIVQERLLALWAPIKEVLSK